MEFDSKPKHKIRLHMIGIRVDDEEKALVEQAAEREGLQVSSFIIMLLVRLHILPDKCLKKLKRRPVPFYNALHGLLGVVNKIGGNCKQLAAAMPGTAGLGQTHACLIRAAAAITDALTGKAIRKEINLYRLQEDITRHGLRFNQIVKSVNVGRPNLGGLPAVLAAVRDAADAITAALTGQPVPVLPDIEADPDEDYQETMEKALNEMRSNMKKAYLLNPPHKRMIDQGLRG